MAKGPSQRPSNTTNATWSSGQAYALALVCLGIGLLVGWFFRGSESPTAATQTTAAAPSGAPAGMPSGTGQTQGPPPIEMVNQQVEPLLQQLKTTPNDPELMAKVGNVYYDAQYYNQAIDYYGKSLKLNPKNVNVRTDMATALFYLGNVDASIKEFEESLKYDPSHPNTLFNLGVVKWQGKQDPKGAVAVWEKLLEKNPNYPEKQKVMEFISRAKQHSTMPPFAGKQG